jgi:hypothetical protein
MAAWQWLGSKFDNKIFLAHAFGIFYDPLIFTGK